MAKTKGHDARTHLPEEITITISRRDDENYFFYKIYEGSPQEINNGIPIDSGYWYGTADTAIDQVSGCTKNVMAKLEKENRSKCELAHDLSEIRNREAKKDKNITR